MDCSGLDKTMIESIVRKVIEEKLKDNTSCITKQARHGIISINLPKIQVSENDRLDTGKIGDIVYTKDLFTLQESPRLGCGVMEMKQTTFDWTLNYDEIDYVIEGTLDIIINGETVSASTGELILIPKGSSIQFSVKDYARFIYVTYPADWASQN